MTENKCNHQIWIYEGSYSVDYDWPDGVFYHEVKYSKENCYKFNHNKYICLDCGKIIKVYDYKEFEKSHQILKNRNIKDVYNYRKLYLKLIKEDISAARKKFVEEFNNFEEKDNICRCNMCKCKKRTK